MELSNWSHLNTCLDNIQNRTDWCQCAEHSVSSSIALKRNWNSHIDAHIYKHIGNNNEQPAEEEKEIIIRENESFFHTNTVKKHSMVFIQWNRHGYGKVRDFFFLSSLNRYKLWTMNFTFSWHKFCWMLAFSSHWIVICLLIRVSHLG